jgi:hypothetical protein
LIARFVQKKLDSHTETLPLKWHATHDDLAALELEASPVEAEGSCHLVIDLKPYVAGNVSLFLLEDVWGWTEDYWTPIAVRLQGLFVDREEDDPKEFKKAFEVPPATDRDGPIHEFLYLIHSGGPQKGWNWARVGATNGALLWPDTLDYFLSCIAGRG